MNKNLATLNLKVFVKMKPNNKCSVVVLLYKLNFLVELSWIDDLNEARVSQSIL